MRRVRTTLAVIALVYLLLASWVWYDYEWLAYQAYGCNCEPVQRADGSAITCQGHPQYSRVLPTSLVDWMRAHFLL
jgi:hypothetical protein